jgi:hypothetical protein
VLTFDIRSNASFVQAQLTNLQRKQLPMAFVRAANRTGREVVLALQKEMDRVFDRPTPWAKRGVRQRLASSSRPVFRVWLEEFGGKGIAAADFLAAEIEGGPRKHKRFEKALIAKGLMSPGSFAVPGGQAQIDAFGNVPAGFIVRMLADLRAFPEGSTYAMRNRKGKRAGRRKTNYFFVPRKGSHLKPGIYWRMPNGMLGVAFIFVSGTAYRKRYDFDGVAAQAYERHGSRLLSEEVTKAMRQHNFT